MNPGPGLGDAPTRAANRDDGRRHRHHRPGQRDQRRDQRVGESGGLKLMQFNCNGVWPRLNELGARLASERPHLILLQEAKLRAGQEAPTFPGYNVAARQDWTPLPDPGPAADRPEPPAPAPPTPPTPPPTPPQDPAETLAAAEAATATGGTTGSRAVAPVRGELPGDERAREERLDPPPRGKLLRACRTAQPDRTRWCRGCRSHRGCDLRRPTAATTTATQDAATVGEPGTPTASLAEESRSSGDPVPATEREGGDRPRGTTCRVLFREERDRWCGAAGGRRGARREKSSQPPPPPPHPHRLRDHRSRPPLARRPVSPPPERAPLPASSVWLCASGVYQVLSPGDRPIPATLHPPCSLRPPHRPRVGPV